MVVLRAFPTPPGAPRDFIPAPVLAESRMELSRIAGVSTRNGEARESTIPDSDEGASKDAMASYSRGGNNLLTP